MTEIPHLERYDWPVVGTSRVASSIASASLEDAQVALIGLPDDTGVLLNGGRAGAAGGPDAFRKALLRYGARNAHQVHWPVVCDAGNVIPGDCLDETHDRVTESISALLDRGLFPIGIGGGHDLTYAFVRAVAERYEPMVGVYMDAHLDVRKERGSGMPFRRLVKDCGVRELHVHGLDPLANTTKHCQWFASHGGRIDTFGPEEPWPTGDLFVSFDLDVIDQAFAPGVSATNPAGWSSVLADRWAHAAGRCPGVRCFDIMELNPRFDVGERTARLAARLFLSFLRGFSEKGVRE